MGQTPSALRCVDYDLGNSRLLRFPRDGQALTTRNLLDYFPMLPKELGIPRRCFCFVSDNGFPSDRLFGQPGMWQTETLPSGEVVETSYVRDERVMRAMIGTPPEGPPHHYHRFIPCHIPNSSIPRSNPMITQSPLDCANCRCPLRSPNYCSSRCTKCGVELLGFLSDNESLNERAIQYFL